MLKIIRAVLETDLTGPDATSWPRYRNDNEREDLKEPSPRIPTRNLWDLVLALNVLRVFNLVAPLSRHCRVGGLSRRHFTNFSSLPLIWTDKTGREERKKEEIERASSSSTMSRLGVALRFPEPNVADREGRCSPSCVRSRACPPAALHRRTCQGGQYEALQQLVYGPIYSRPLIANYTGRNGLLKSCFENRRTSARISASWPVA